MDWLRLVRPREWVVAQVGLLVAVAVAGGGGRLFGSGSDAWRQPVGAVLVMAGLSVALPSAFALGASLTPSPQPNLAGLVTHGWHRWVRHPLYAGVVVGYLGLVLWFDTSHRLWWWFALVALYLLKARREDQLLADAYDGFAQYARRTGRLVPGIGRLR